MRYGLVGVDKAESLLKERNVKSNEKTFEILENYQPETFNIRQATFLFEDGSELQKDLLAIQGSSSVILEIDFSKLNLNKLFVMNSAIASRLNNYSEKGQRVLAEFYWKSAIIAKKFLDNRKEIENSFSSISMKYQAEFVYFSSISPRYITQKGDGSHG